MSAEILFETNFPFDPDYEQPVYGHLRVVVWSDGRIGMEAYEASAQPGSKETSLVDGAMVDTADVWLWLTGLSKVVPTII